uniref:USP domain-containing protein n=1 Tax=viral metagenome TaxID=1070528 RepID=A0A6C0J2L3_9ZZZZ
MFGLRNQSGSCWVNATLQAVFRIPDVQTRYSNSETDDTNAVDVSLEKIWASRGDDGLTDLYQCVKTTLMPAGEGIGDSHELLEFLCDKLPYLDKLMRFNVGNKVKCSHCDYTDVRTDKLIEFSVTPAQRKQTLIECIRQAVSPVEIPDWKCDKCKEKGCTKQLLMATFPDIFVFHVTSLKSSVAYSPMLVLNGNRYALFGIVCWNGGHWWTYGRSLPPGSDWLEFDDSNVRNHGKTNFPLSENMRLLFYYRIKE